MFLKEVSANKSLSTLDKNVSISGEFVFGADHLDVFFGG